MPKFYGIESNNSLVNLADVTGSMAFYRSGIYGQNTTSWVVDSQLVGTNLVPAENFSNVAYTYAAPDVLTNPGAHATWCAGLLGGYVSPGYYLNTGMAPYTILGSGALATATNADGSFEISNQSLSAYNYAAAHGDVLSTSIGDSSDPAGVGTLSGLLDALAVAHPNNTIVAAAGNDGTGSGSVGGPASGYNTISVGALDGPTNYSSVASFSSRGPQPTAWYEGTTTNFYNGGVATRPGVDLVAPGADIVMPATMVVSSNSISFSYYSISGTSFAAPLVAGGAALLDSTAKTSFSASITNAATQSMVVKAALMNSADKLPGWDNGQHIVDGVITTTQALDWAMGAGRLNLNEAYTQYTTSAVVTTTPGLISTGFTMSAEKTGWAYGSVQLGGRNDYQLVNQLLGGQQIAVTLAWMRDRSWSEALSDYVDIAQAKLDLMVYKILSGGAEQLVAESTSPVSTTQELYFQLQDPGTYKIAVGYSTNLFDLSGNYDFQNYGLAWSVFQGALCVGSNTSGEATNFTSGINAYSSTFIGYYTGDSNNLLCVSGPGTILTNSGDIFVGYAGAINSLVISNGAQVADRNGWIGTSNTAFSCSVMLSDSGSLWSNSGTLFIGNAGGGTLTVVNEGRVVANGGITIGALAGSSGMMNIGRYGSGDAAGIITTPFIAFGNGGGAINFNQRDAFILGANISGPGSLHQLGGGTTTLTGSNSFSGVTSVSSGILSLGANARLSATTLVQISGGTLLLGGSNQVSTNAAMSLGGGVLSMRGNGVARAPAQSFSMLTLTANSVIDFASLSGTSSLTFGNIAGLGDYKLFIYDWNGTTAWGAVSTTGGEGAYTKLYDTAGGLGSLELGNISFFSGQGDGFLGVGTFVGNQIIPVPEPVVSITVLLLLGSLVVLRLARGTFL